LHRIVYISYSLIKPSDLKSSLQNISEIASSRNKLKHISGQLIAIHGYFIQLLEGEFTELNELMNKINQDSRHSGIQVIYDSPISQRLLSDWSQMEVITDPRLVAPLNKCIEGIASLPVNTVISEENTIEIMKTLMSYHRPK
jgi:hypothetical protein